MMATEEILLRIARETAEQCAKVVDGHVAIWQEKAQATNDPVARSLAEFAEKTVAEVAKSMRSISEKIFTGAEESSR